MRRTTLSLLACSLLAATAACSSSTTSGPAAATTPPAAGATGAPAAPASPKAAAPANAPDAATVAAKIKKAIPSIKTTKNITADDDPNKLLGRPHQYTSATVLVDSRIDSSTGSVDRGAVIEVFATADDAKARFAYIDAIGKAQPLFAEQDFLHGAVLVRVAKALTPAQAAEYDKAAG
ncbi:hypothetical protein ACFYUY_01245 [Kitasatospora sp. NPDC004745]|uniref:hypothetical protein n=1 Tax=Kitasatospora sp. NPDC004745 TaxID=3364019 RepID=UPI0036800DDA